MPDNPQQTIHARKTQTVTNIPEDCNAEDLGFEIVDAPDPATTNKELWENLHSRAQDMVKIVEVMRQEHETATKSIKHTKSIERNYNRIYKVLSDKSHQDKIPLLETMHTTIDKIVTLCHSAPPQSAPPQHAQFEANFCVPEYVLADILPELTLHQKELAAFIATWQALATERSALNANHTGRAKEPTMQEKKLKEQEKNLEKQQKKFTKDLEETLEKLRKNIRLNQINYNIIIRKVNAAMGELQTTHMSLLQRQHIVEKGVSYLTLYDTTDRASLTANHNPELPAEGSANALSPPQTASTTPKEDSQ